MPADPSLGSASLAALAVVGDHRGLAADPDVVDPTYEATPLGWAEHNDCAEAADYLRPLTGRAEPGDGVATRSPDRR